MDDEKYMELAIELSRSAVDHGNEPFGAVLVKNDKVVFTNENQIYTMHDPTFHGEAGLIRRFCAETGITEQTILELIRRDNFTGSHRSDAG